MRCPDPQALEDLALGRLNAEARAACEAHIDGCPECARLVAELARVYATGDLATAPTVLRSATDERHSAPIGAQVGRYRLEEQLGAGGMGVVYRAYDPELDRRVAIKLLHPGVFADAHEQRARLRQEAQAMAKLSHPNVVSVYDVGSVGDQVFLAAELVDGSTLSRWLRASPRPRQEILRCFLEAGQGLEAAHQAGIVHRDFKPDNVLIGRDGRARVTDFGLARTARPSTSEPSPAPASATPSTMTRTGALAGTPPYMAPELWLGRRADSLSDQFAFTVALYEAIFGVRPFVGEDLGALARAIAGGAARPVPSGTPAWLSRLIARGLEVAPEKRFPSMAELLRELRRDRRRPLRIGLWATGIALAATGLALAFGAFLQPPPAPSLTPAQTVTPSKAAARICSVGAVAATWNPERKRAVEQAFASTWPASLGKRVLAALDGYALRLARARETICAKPELPPGSHRCLERRREALAALVSALKPERRRLRLARPLVDGLAAPESCVEGASVPAEPPPASQGRVALLHADLVAARVELAFLETLKAKDELERLRPAAEALGYAPLVAEARFVDGLVRQARGELSPAAELLEQALGTARAANDLELAWEAALALVELSGELVSPSERWGRQAGELLPRDDAAAAQRLAVATARALRASGELVKAQALLDAKRGAGSSAATAIALGVAASENALALEKNALALERASAAAREAERSWDAEDPGWIAIEHARARALAAAGRGEEALPHLRRAETLAFDAYGLGAEAVARSYDETGAVLEGLGRFAAAHEKYARGLAARTLIRDDNPAQSRSRLLLGRLRVVEGHARGGARQLATTVRTLRTLHRSHPTALVAPLHSLARAQLAAGERAAAGRTLSHAVEIVESHHGLVSPLLGFLRLSQAEVKLAAGDKRGALSDLDEAHLPLQGGYGLHHARVDANVRRRAELAEALGDHAYAKRLTGALKK